MNMATTKKEAAHKASAKNTYTKGGVELNKKSPQTDTRKESQETGEVTTDEGIKVKAVSPAIPHGAEYEQDEESEAFTADEQETLLGELEPGEEGYLPTDEEGNVTGPAVKEQPEFSVKVYAHQKEKYLLTPSGAEIYKRMNPDTKEESGAVEPEYQKGT
jgi:hypothetical protein